MKKNLLLVLLSIILLVGCMSIKESITGDIDISPKTKLEVQDGTLP